MGDEDVYVGNIRNYYNIPHTIINGRSRLKECCGEYPDGKAQRRESRRRAIRRRKGRL